MRLNLPFVDLDHLTQLRDFLRCFSLVGGHAVGNQQREAVENRSARIERYAVNWFN
jgi:hypothetical protein